jgi:hypothetical protein
MKDVFNENPLLKMQLAMCWRHSRPPAPAIEASNVCKRNRQRILAKNLEQKRLLIFNTPRYVPEFMSLP